MYKNILNIKFIESDYKKIIKKLELGSFMVVPSGPGLATIDIDKKYYKSLLHSDFALVDSSFMALLYRLFYFKRIRKLSGAKFIRKFFNEDILKEQNSLFLIDPSNKEMIKNRLYLKSKGIRIEDDYQYVAPFYDKEDITDYELLEKLEKLKNKPKFILINLGGGVQERLGYHLKNHLTFKVGIICTGAAISFLTGSQAKIPKFIDKIYLGWLFRIIQNPRAFLIRYLKAFRLIYVFIKFRLGKIKNE